MPQRMLIATRAGRPEHTPEAEPVVVEIVPSNNGATNDIARLTLDDGETLEFDRRELHEATAPAHALRRAA